MDSEIAHHVRPPHRKASRGRLVAALVAFGLLLAAAIAAGLIPRLHRERALAAAVREDAAQAPVVSVARVEESEARGNLELPGNLMPQVETPVYARADGYVRRRLVDMGDHVRAGQVLAEIETPELDQQIEQANAALSQARANLLQMQANGAQARANLNLAAVTARRWKNLAAKGVFAQQDADEKQANLEAQQAQVQAAEAGIAVAENTIAGGEANLRRLEDLKSFDKVAAPYAGVITARDQNLDAGTLINAGNNGPNRELFRVAQVDPLRIFVNVPQTYVESIRPGQTAKLTVDEIPGRVFTATVKRTTDSLDTTSRTLLTILEVPNPQGLLLPGMYGKVQFALTHAMRTLLIPADALVVRADGTQAAVVGDDRKIHFRKIGVGVDYGARVEVTSGLTAGERVVVSPTDVVRENATVEPRAWAK
ncbi:MAG: efflux RND transporter periplasmic adaptor subunit [Bryobacteraceae bacterium]